MDKKGSRSVQNSTQKSLVTDQKKDVGNGTRPWPSGGRGGFNRGGNGSGCSSLGANKSESTRSKPRHNQQRFAAGGYGNKRPQQRGGSGYYQVGGGGGNTVATATGLDSVICDELDESVDPELGSVFVQGTKKQNLNHLLNFHYTRAETDHRCNSRIRNAGGVGRGGGKAAHGRWITTEKHKYNKEHYLQANCQFLVKADGDYTKYLNNPDTLVDWDLIEQINIHVNEVPSCPICLYPALAAKATRCGHVFCWACILHYLALSDERWRKCPICYEAVHKQHLKSVVMIPHAVFSLNEPISFTLMKRVKGSLIAYPIDHFDSLKVEIQSPTSPQSPKSPSNILHLGTTVTETSTSKAIVTNEIQFLHTLSELRKNTSIQCKLVLATSDDVLKIVERERNDLLLQKMDLVSVEVNPELCFVEAALELLNLREIQLLAKKTSEVSIASNGIQLANMKLEHSETGTYSSDFEMAKQNDKVLQTSDDLAEDSILDDRYLSPEENTLFVKDIDVSKEFGGISLLEGENAEIVSELDAVLKSNTETREHERQNCLKTFYFYQASDGQHIYLHAINARMLEHTYGSLEFAPHIINGKILEKEAGSITEQLRNRVRYLQHLPLTCQVEVAEIDLDVPVVSEETMAVYRAQLCARQKRRNLRIRSESRREKRILEDENRQLGRCLASSPMYTTNLHLDSPNHFPSVETSAALALTETNTNLGFIGRFRTDSERSEGRQRSSRSSSPSGSVFGSVGGSSIASGGRGIGWGEEITDGNEKKVEGVGVEGPSFAKMLLQSPKLKKSQAFPWPILNQTKSSVNNPRASFGEDSEGEPEDYIPAPAYNNSFSDAIAMALEKAAAENDVESKNDNGSHSKGGKKKKKAKQKILFATSMSFTGH